MINFGSDDLEWVIDCYDNLTRLLELHRDYYWILDRFHISTVAHQRLQFGREVQLDWVDKRLRCLLYTSDAADERSSVDLGGRRIIKKKTSAKRGRCRMH